MAFEDINFPVYRRYKNNKHFFKISSRTQFEELQRIGSRVIVNAHEATQLPEFNMIYDLVYNYHNFAAEISPEEYNSVKAAAEK